MAFSELLDYISDGACLSENEVYQLALHLGLEKNKPMKILKIFISIIMVLLGVAVYFVIDPVLGLVIDVIIIFTILVMFRKKQNLTAIHEYFSAIKKYYDKRFEEYRGFKMITVCRNVFAPGEDTKRLCYLFSDGYEFYLFDDCLIDTSYDLPKGFKSNVVLKPILKVFDYDLVNKSILYFKITDINFYKAYIKKNEDLSYQGYDLYTISNKKIELNSYVWVQLFNKEPLKFDINVLEFLRIFAKDKEKF